MTNRFRILPLFLLILLTVGCAQQADVAAEQAALRSLADEWVAAANAHDVDKVVALYTADASLLPPDAPVATGAESIRENLATGIEDPSYSVTVETSGVEVARTGDVATSQGTYSVTMNDPEGNPMTREGKWMTLAKKQADGSWRLAWHIWNVRPPEAAGAM